MLGLEECDRIFQADMGAKRKLYCVKRCERSDVAAPRNQTFLLNSCFHKIFI